jgi:hypothetical protein
VQSELVAGGIFGKAKFSVDGHIQRFSQLQLETSAGALNDGLLSRSSTDLGMPGPLVEVSNFDLACRAAVLSVNEGENEEQNPGIGLDTHLLEPCFLVDNIFINEAASEAPLLTVVKVVDKPAQHDPGYCDLPYIHNLVASFPRILAEAKN